MFLEIALKIALPANEKLNGTTTQNKIRLDNNFHVCRLREGSAG